MAATGTYDRSHVLVFPKHFIVLRGFQLAFGCILFGFGIFGIIFAPFSGIILTFVTAIVTITTAGYTIGSERSPHAKAYNYWAILGLEIFCVLFWLISFALVATVVGLVAATYYGGVTYSTSYSDDYYDYDYDYDYDYTSTKMLIKRGSVELGKRYASGYTAAVAIFGAAAGIGAVEFVLYVVSLVLLSIRIHKHRKAGGHCKPGKGLPTTQGLGGAPMYGQGYPEGKIELMPQTGVSPVSPPTQSVTPQPGTMQSHGPAGYAQYQQ